MATAGAILWSTTAATNATVDPAVNFAEGQAPSSLNDSNRGAMASFARWRNDVSVGTVTAGTSTAYTLVTNATFASLAAMDGALLCFAVHTANGAAPTLAVDGLAAKNLVSATGVTLAAGVFSTGTVVLASYLNSASEFRVVGAPIIPDLAISTAKIANDAVTYAKLQNVAAVSLVGNATGSSADATGITLGTGLAFSGSTLTVGAVGTIQDLTSGTAATYTPTSGARWIKVRAVGGGGGTQLTGTAATSGGNTIFNAIEAAGGAEGGGTTNGNATAGVGGIGGTGGTGTANVRIPGGQGAAGIGFADSGGTIQLNAPGGQGGDSQLGRGGQNNTNAAANSGGGAGGSPRSITTANASSGGGGGGEYFELILTATTYTYTVGAAGAAGTSGQTGGTGRIIVEEYYS